MGTAITVDPARESRQECNSDWGMLQQFTLPVQGCLHSTGGDLVPPPPLCQPDMPLMSSLLVSSSILGG